MQDGQRGGEGREALTLGGGGCGGKNVLEGGRRRLQGGETGRSVDGSAAKIQLLSSMRLCSSRIHWILFNLVRGGQTGTVMRFSSPDRRAEEEEKTTASERRPPEGSGGRGTATAGRYVFGFW